MERPIEYWRDYYVLHSKSRQFKKQLDKAKDCIEEYLSLDVSSYVSLSGGKDSTALTHLVSTIDPTIQVMSEKDDLDFPNEKEYVQSLCNFCGMDLDIIEPKNIIEKLSKVDFTEDVHSQGTYFSDEVFYKLLKKYQEDNNYKGVFLGLRSQESNARRWNRKTKGKIYYNNSWKQMVCQPIVDWSAKDVFAYLFSNEIDIMPIYFQTKFHESPEEIRKSWTIPSGESQRGKAVWLKWYYPEIYKKLQLINPKINCYV